MFEQTHTHNNIFYCSNFCLFKTTTTTPTNNPNQQQHINQKKKKNNYSPGVTNPCASMSCKKPAMTSFSVRRVLGRVTRSSQLPCDMTCGNFVADDNGTTCLSTNLSMAIGRRPCADVVPGNNAPSNSRSS